MLTVTCPADEPGKGFKIAIADVSRHVSTYAATSRQSHNSPTPRHAATPAHWLHSSDSPHTTSRGTTSPRASACPGRLCLPSLRSVADTHSTGTKWHEP